MMCFDRVAAADAFSYLAEKFPAGMSKYGIRAIQELCRLISERPNLETSFKKSLVYTLGMLAKVIILDPLSYTYI